MNANIESVSARKFLEVAMNSGDIKLFFSIFKFFELRNLRIRGSSNFVKGIQFGIFDAIYALYIYRIQPFIGEHCDQFVEHFYKLFGTQSSLNI